VNTVSELREFGDGVVGRIVWLRTRVARATAVPMLVRASVWVAGAAAMALALPPEVLLSGPGLFLLAVAAIPAIAPRTSVVTVVTLVPVVAWLASTSGYGVPTTLARLLGLAMLLYLVHSTAALAGQLPYDAVVSPMVLLRWFARVALVLAATAVVGVYALVAGQLFRGPATLVATVVGLAVAVGIAAVLARFAPSRQPPSD
jgi:hypothetical protein